MPISSVTLAWRTLVTSGNLWLSSQITGVLMSLGGYMSHKRVCCGPLAEALAGEVFFFALGIVLLRVSSFEFTQPALASP